jgi:tetratricopeptide (TPR) repeat protein
METSAPSDPRDGGRRRAFDATQLVLLGILAVALCIRVVYALQMRSSPYFDHPDVDQRFYVEAGRAVAEGREILPGPLVRPPLYGWWLGSIFKCFGPGLLVPRLFQALVGTLTVLLVFRLGARAFDARTGCVAAFLAATYWVLVYYDGELLRESLANPLNLAGVLMTLKLSEKPSWRSATGSGLAWGFSALLRSQVLAVVPFLGAWLLWHSRIGWRRVLLFAAGVALPVLPITAYNRIVGKDDVLISAEAGQALWTGNNPRADGVTPVLPGMRVDFWGGYEDTRQLAELEEGRPLRPSEVSHHYVRKTLSWIAHEPAQASRLLLRKVWLLCSDFEFGNPEEPTFFAPRFAPIVRWLPLGFGLALAFALVGLVAAGRSRLMSLFPSWGFIAAYGATVVASLVSGRYREPLVPVLLVFSAFGGLWILDAARSGRWTRFAIALGGVALAYTGSRSYPVDKAVSRANGLCWLAAAEWKADRADQARSLYQEAIAVSPSSCEAYRGLGLTCVLAGQNEKAIAAFEHAIRLCPDDIYALDGLAEAYLRLGRTADAIPLAQSSIAIAPHRHRGHYNLGRAYFEQGRIREAEEEFQLSLARNPTDFDSRYMLGVVSRTLGDRDQAIEAMSEAVAVSRNADERFVYQAYRDLIDLLVEADRKAEARRTAEAMVQRFPDRPETGVLLKRLER